MMIWKTVALLTLALCAQGRKIPLDEMKRQLVNEEVHHGKLVHIGSHEIEPHEGYNFVLRGGKSPLYKIKRQLVNKEAPQEELQKVHKKLVHIGSHEIRPHGGYAPAYPKYEFSYMVNDPHTHDEKGQRESRNGDEVKGEYWLVQPDGKKRTVTYHSDKHTGFKAHVVYSHHHHPVEDVIIPIIKLQEKDPHHDLIQIKENDKSKNSEEHQDEVKEEEKRDEEEKKDEEPKDEEKELPVVHREYHTQIEHPLPIHKNHREPLRHIPEVHELHEEDEKDKHEVRKEWERSFHGSHYGRKTPVLRYTKVGASEIDLGPVKPVLVDSITDVERRHDVDRHHVERPRLYRPRPVPLYLRTRHYRDSQQKNAEH